MISSASQWDTCQYELEKCFFGDKNKLEESLLNIWKCFESNPTEMNTHKFISMATIILSKPETFEKLGMKQEVLECIYQKAFACGIIQKIVNNRNTPTVNCASVEILRPLSDMRSEYLRRMFSREQRPNFVITQKEVFLIWDYFVRNNCINPKANSLGEALLFGLEIDCKPFIEAIRPHILQISSQRGLTQISMQLQEAADELEVPCNKFGKVESIGTLEIFTGEEITFCPQSITELKQMELKYQHWDMSKLHLTLKDGIESNLQLEKGSWTTLFWGTSSKDDQNLSVLGYLDGPLALFFSLVSSDKVASVESLDLSHYGAHFLTHFSADHFVKCFDRFKNLKHLSLSHLKFKLDVQILESLILAIPGLQKLDLADSKIDEGHLKVIAKAKNLEILHLQNYCGTPESLAVLEPLENLKFLDISGHIDDYQDIPQVLLRTGLRVEISNTSVLHQAIDKLDVDVVRKVRSSHAKEIFENKAGPRLGLLHFVCRKKSTDNLKKFLICNLIAEINRTAIFQEDEAGLTPIHYLFNAIAQNLDSELIAIAKKWLTLRYRRRPQPDKELKDNYYNMVVAKKNISVKIPYSIPQIKQKGNLGYILDTPQSIWKDCVDEITTYLYQGDSIPQECLRTAWGCFATNPNCMNSSRYICATVIILSDTETFAKLNITQEKFDKIYLQALKSNIIFNVDRNPRTAKISCSGVLIPLPLAAMRSEYFRTKLTTHLGTELTNDNNPNLISKEVLCIWKNFIRTNSISNTTHLIESLFFAHEINSISFLKAIAMKLELACKESLSFISPKFPWKVKRHYAPDDKCSKMNLETHEKRDVEALTFRPLGIFGLAHFDHDSQYQCIDFRKLLLRSKDSMIDEIKKETLVIFFNLIDKRSTFHVDTLNLGGEVVEFLNSLKHAEITEYMSKFANVKYLDLSNIYFTLNPQVLESIISSFPNIQELNLSGCQLSDLSGIEKAEKLEILKLNGSKGPSDMLNSLIALNHLKMLDVTNFIDHYGKIPRKLLLKEGLKIDMFTKSSINYSSTIGGCSFTTSILAQAVGSLDVEAVAMLIKTHPDDAMTKSWNLDLGMMQCLCNKSDKHPYQVLLICDLLTEVTPFSILKGNKEGVTPIHYLYRTIAKWIKEDRNIDDLIIIAKKWMDIATQYNETLTYEDNRCYF